MKIGIVTVTYNSRHVLEDFFASMGAQSFKKYCLYIVDSASTDDTVGYVRDHVSHDWILIRNDQNIGFAAGTNQGIRAAFADGCTAILALNNDVVFGPDLLQQLVNAMDQHQCEMVAPMMYYNEPKTLIWAAGGNLVPWLGYRCEHRGKDQTDQGQYDVACPITFAPLCCVLIRKEVFDRIGLLDERYFTYTEDVDFMFRAFRQGLKMYFIPEAKLWHKVSALTGGDTSDFLIRYCTRNRIYFLRKNLSVFSAMLWCNLYRFYLRIRAWTGRDSTRVSALKRLSVREGVELSNQLRLP